MEDPAAASSKLWPHRTSSRSEDLPLAAAAPNHDGAPSICRICRGEATPQEPLFYPCKCSGSIKYVHQDCLMEWLSHSQKKYCELCKTSFRFTKLYDPDMPQSLPVHVFLGHMAKYLLRKILVWLRAAVAISVWVCWLPYFMRSVWSFMFWVSDEGLGSTSMLSRLNDHANETVDLETSWSGRGTCPSSPLFAETTTSASTAEAILKGMSGHVSDFLMRMILSSISMPTKVTRADMALGQQRWINATASRSNGSSLAATESPSLLSDVTFLRCLTRNPTINRTLITILEGQIITILVIVCFILVILVRDYVVQQQPDVNRAVFAVPENPPPEEPPADIREDVVEELRGPDESDAETLDDGQQAIISDEDGDGPTAGQLYDLSALQPIPLMNGEARFNDAINRGVYDIPEGDESDGSVAEERATVNDYLRIYRRADGDPEKILEIVEEEGLEEKLSYWVGVTRRSMRRDVDPGDLNTDPALDPLMRGDRPVSSGSGEGSSNVAFTPVSSSQSDHGGSDFASSSQQPKGKEKEAIPTPPESHPQTPSSLLGSQSSLARPRAASDSPQLQDSVNPLGNNSWSFANLPSDTIAEDSELASAVEHAAAREVEAKDQSVQEIRQKLKLMRDSLDANQRAAGVLDRSDEETQRSDNGITPPSSMFAEASTPPPIRNSSDFGDFTDDQPQPSGIRGEYDADAEEQSEEGSANHLQAIEDAPTDVPAVGDEGQRMRLVDRVADFMWGGLDQHDHVHHHADDHQHAEDDGDEEEWVDEPEGDGGEDDMAADAGDVDAGAAAAAGLDPEAIEDLEDFEGVMELIGMRGPIAGLFQNAIFCAVLVSVTIFACIFLPYNIGRITVWILANPLRLVRMLFELSKMVQDAAILLGSLASWCALNIVDMVMSFVGEMGRSQVVSARKASWTIFTSAGSRVLDFVFMDFPMSATEIQNFSAISHAALIAVRAHVTDAFAAVDHGLTLISGGDPEIHPVTALATGAGVVWRTLLSLSTLLMNPSSWVIDLSEAEKPLLINYYELAHWPSLDRFWAILAGYITLFFIGAMYLKRGSPFSRGSIIEAWEAGVIVTLHQASGIMKVILIISIEMLVFPLYCGLLLDAALLPLFEDTTFKSRMLFTYNYPLTSVFVHWFVGTGYMFHFALFVSMCRKIMRPGVLYFIRDPDDPEFHPVRDVLERNLTTQLRKILFSAFVYGALVIVCLGGVVWGLSLTMPNVLPIHYSSNEPVLEFPVDLLFYNFLMPLAVKFFKPGDGLHAMYTWWFRKCARGLRLTYFLFGERRIDEEGTLQLAEDSPERNRGWYATQLLELDGTNRVIPKTWMDTFEGGNAKPNPPLSDAEMTVLRHKKSHLVHSGQLVRGGRFVRAPASDRVKIPKGKKVFLTVTEKGNRRDGKADTDLYASSQYQVVYIPPSFRTRVFLFILFIWMFAAVTGVGFTIVPLIFGRKMFKVLIPEHIRTNDIYAFSIGIYLLGSLAYSIVHVRKIWGKVQGWFEASQDAVAQGSARRRVASVLIRGAKLLYAYFFLLVVFPLLVSAMMELYLNVPLHTYLNPPATVSTQGDRDKGADASRHSIRVIQAWTLGLLYLKLAARVVTVFFFDTRLATAVRIVLRRGWLHPDVGVLTRAFVIPGLAVSALAIAGPPAITSTLFKHGVFATTVAGSSEAADAARMAVIYRQSYPVAACIAITLRYAIGMATVFHGWTARIRDEAYLIGERLHNFGVGAAGARGTRVAWKAGGPRL